MPILLSDILQSDQRKAVDSAASLFKSRRTLETASNWLFYSGDHWQNGKGWIGAKPLSLRAANQTMLQIREGFLSENVIKEVVDRHIAGLLGREPLWGFVPNTTLSQSTQARRRRFSKLFNFVTETVDSLLGRSIDARAQEADDALTLWWDSDLVKPKQKLKDALARCLNEDRVLLRFFVPRGLYRQSDSGPVRTIPPQKNLADALNILRIDVVSSDQGGVFVDSDTQRPFALYVYEVDKHRCVELSYVNELGQTILRVLSDRPDLVVDPIPYDLQGRLWMHEIVRPALITEQIRAEQRSLNLTKTMMMRNVNLAGNLERTIINAERPKTKIQIYDPNIAGNYREETIDSEFLVGPGVTNALTGLLIKDQNGQIVGRANPNISYRDPVPIDTFVGTRRECRESILGQAQQLHIMISGDATVSGRSREQARGEYRSSLQDSKDPFDGAGRWILETGLWLAAQFSNRVDDFAKLRCVFDCRVEDGPVSPEERSANREDVKAGLLSRESAMSRNGTEDTDAEKQRIIEERAESPTPNVLPPPSDPNNPGRELVQ